MLEYDAALQTLKGMPDGANIRPFVKGGTWRNFLAKYPESNRMHKKMLRLSQFARKAGDPPAARRAVGRAQCNDAYWHGVFGGLYLPHLRAAVWRELATAEGILRAGEALAWEHVDFDEDGHAELWIHSAAFSAVVSPRRGGGIEEYTRFATGVNHVDVLSRRIEAYHEVAVPSHETVEAPGGTPATHDLDRGLTQLEVPPLDPEPRALFLERIYGPETDVRVLEASTPRPQQSWAARPCAWRVDRDGDALRVTLSPEDDPDGLRKTYRFTADGLTAVDLTWRAPEAPDAWFATEISHDGTLRATGSAGVEMWEYQIDTVAKSERGLERTRQGTATVLRWPASLGSASVSLER
jgi:alpha-amylase